MYLLLRTDKPEAELGLYSKGEEVIIERWTAHHQLAETLHKKIKLFLESNDAELQKLRGIVVYKGPGSFTGLRIGISCANALAYAYNMPIVAMQGDAWIVEGIAALENEKNDVIALPEYGSEPRTTIQKK
jgi:tRNA threonylcarbamoyladenosine biosynthesis protein TsaB